LQDVDRRRQLAAVLAMKTSIPTLLLGAVNAKNKQLFHILYLTHIVIHGH
jgi:hypothetical protein